jgi:hypothetical protein
MQVQTARPGEGSMEHVAAMELFVPTPLIFTPFSNGLLEPKDPSQAAAPLPQPRRE